MDKPSEKNSLSNKYIWTITILLAVILIYILVGLVLGYIGLWLQCRNLLYQCIGMNQYLTDPWLLINTVFWPMTLWSGLEKSNIL